jgi:hypothetical protein
MANRTGVYTAFNGCGTTDPTESDIKYFNTLKMWDESEKINFTFIDSHSKTSAVKDTSDKEKTLFPRLQERLKLSKVFFLIVTDETKNGSDVVEFEIEKAIETYNLPIILAYTGEDILKEVTSNHEKKLPKVLLDKMKEGKVKALFIPFKLKAIKYAINFFNVQNTNLNNTNYLYDKIDSWD